MLQLLICKLESQCGSYVARTSSRINRSCILIELIYFVQALDLWSLQLSADCLISNYHVTKEEVSPAN